MKNIFTLLWVSYIFFQTPLVYAQMAGDDVFMKGLYTELGLCAKGAFGSAADAPAGYHPRTLSAFETSTHLGFVCDVDMDGWTTGTPEYFGDYFTPGGAQEGWDIQLNNNWLWPDDPAGERWAKMWRHPTEGGATTSTIIPTMATEYLISGSNTDYYVSGRNKVAVWEGEMGSASTTFHIGIRQEVILDTIKRYFVIKVTFKSLSTFFGSPTFYYDRTVDPDNDRAFSATFNTENTIVNQPDISDNKCLVTAEGSFYSDRNYLGLGTLDCRAKAYVCTTTIFPPAIKPLYESGTGALTAEGSNMTGDIGMGIIFKIPPMSFGDSTTISYAYVLNEDELEEALALTAPAIHISGTSYTDGDTLTICSFDTLNAVIENDNGLNWGEWMKDGTGTGITGTSIPVFPESFPYTLSVIGTSTSCMSDTLTLVVKSDIRLYTLDTTICSGQTFSFGGTEYATPVTGITDTFSTASGCDSIVVLNLDFNPADTVTTDTFICPGDSYTFYGTEYTTAGTYYYFDTIGIQCDTIHTLNLTVHPTYAFVINETICEGESYAGYTTAGTYHDTFSSVYSCDSIRTLHLTVHPVYTFTITEEICAGESYDSYTASGIYMDTFTTVNGCDSIRTLNLTVYPAYAFSMDEAICEGDSYLGYSATGIYHDTFTTVNGCDSIRTVNLTVHPVYTITIDEEICEGGSYDGYSAAGTYHDTFATVNGCDSIRILNLIVHPVYTFSIEEEICEGENYDGYTTSGIYLDTFTSINGCDSIRTLDLTVHPLIFNDITDTICQGESMYGYSATGIYTDTFAGANDCDSIVTLNLTVMPAYDQTQEWVLCRNELPYEYLGVTVPVGSVSTGAYAEVLLTNVYGCDSMITINLTIRDTSRTDIDTLVCHNAIFEWNGVHVTAPGEYYYTTDNAAGCDSMVRISVAYTPAPLMTDSFIRACGEAAYLDEVYYADTTFTDTFRNVIQCDSLYRTVTIDIQHIAYDTLNAAICEGEQYDFNGESYTSPGTYTQTFTNYNGCDSFITLELTVHPLPDVHLSYESFGEELLCVGDSILLVGSGAEQYVYYDILDREIDYRDSVWVRLLFKDNRFYVIGTDDKGCSMKSEVVIYAEDCCDILVPNAFSPNGDGLNDKFGVVTLGHPQNFDIQIFDRWGKLVFVSYDADIQWDGTYNGSLLDVGVYYFVIRSNCSDGTPFNHKGEVHLIR